MFLGQYLGVPQNNFAEKQTFISNINNIPSVRNDLYQPPQQQTLLKIQLTSSEPELAMHTTKKAPTHRKLIRDNIQPAQI